MVLIEKLKKAAQKRQIVKIIKARIKLKIIPIKDIRCQVSTFAENQGFSGKTIDHFPPCKFFKMYLENTEKAKQAFMDWLTFCLIELETWRMDREQGGWRDGSLIEIIYAVHKEHGQPITRFENANPDLVRKGVQQKVNYYFGVLESIQKNGYAKTTVPPILCYHVNGLYYLGGGHHRVSILHTLGVKQAHVRINEKSRA